MLFSGIGVFLFACTRVLQKRELLLLFGCLFDFVVFLVMGVLVSFSCGQRVEADC